MGDFFERSETPPPQVIPGTQFVLNLLKEFGKQTKKSGIGEAFAEFRPGQTGALRGITNQALQSLGIVGPAADVFGEGLLTGFAPDILESVESRLLPALERSFERSGSALKEQASQLGTLTGSGTVQGLSDLRGNLEGGLLSNLAGIEADLARGAQGIRGGLAGQGVATLLPLVNTALGESQFGRTQPLRAGQVVTGGAANAPFFQPTTQPSKFETIAGSAGGAAGKGLSGTGGGGSKGGPSTGSSAGGSPSSGSSNFNNFTDFSQSRESGGKF